MAKITETLQTTQVLGENGSIHFIENATGNKVATWNGHTNLMVFVPAQGNGPAISVGYHQPERLRDGLVAVARLRDMERVSELRRVLKNYDTWEAEVNEIVKGAVGIDVEWDWPSRDLFDAGLEPHEAAVECIEVAYTI